MIHRSAAEELYTQGRSHLEAAVTADEKQNYAVAKTEYEHSCELYLLGIRKDHNKQRRTQTINRVKNYLARAEAIKTKLADHTQTHPQSEPGNKHKEGKGLDQVAGLDHVKEALKEAVLLPMLQPQVFSGKRKPWKGVLLFGPPGTGKSYIIEKLTEDVDMNFINISAADIMSKWQGESEKAVRNMFVQAQEKIDSNGKSCVIFIDEIDSLGRKRDLDTGSNTQESHVRVLSELLRQMDGVSPNKKGKGNIIVIGATNHAEELDFALRRRFEKRLYIPMPGVKTRLKIFEKSLGEQDMFLKKSKRKLHNLQKKDFIELARMTKGYSSSDIAIIINEAMMLPIRRCLQATHFKEIPKPEVDPDKANVGSTTQATSNGLVNSVINFFSRPKTVLVPCKPSDPGAKRMKLLDKDFPADRLLVPLVNFEDVKKSVLSLKPSVSPEEIKKHEEFAIKFCGDKLTMKDGRLDLKDDEDLTDAQLGLIVLDNTLFEKESIESKHKPEKTTLDDRWPIMVFKNNDRLSGRYDNPAEADSQLSDSGERLAVPG